MTTEENYLFNCSTNSLPHLSAVLNGLPSTSTKIHFIANNEGVFFTSTDSKVSLIEVFFEAALFSTFTLREDHEEIRISLDSKSLMESLNIASKETNQISIFLKELGDDLVLIYQDVKIVERCQLHTYIGADSEINTDLEIGDECEWEICLNDGSMFFEVLKDFKDLLALHVYLTLTESGDLYVVGLTDTSSSIVYKVPAKFVDTLNKTDEILYLKNTQVALVLRMIRSASKVKVIKSQHILRFQIFTNQLINSLSSYKDTVINITMMRVEHEFVRSDILRAIAIENEDESTAIEGQQDGTQHNHQQQQRRLTEYDDSMFNNSYHVPHLERTHSDHRTMQQFGANENDGNQQSLNDNLEDDDDFEVPAFL
ncbi:hypothetical protein WICPIJ_001095 [Wickerhamomyces pijperi]|uniref:DNA damage checkpoint control protein RAD17 n=1 Tax=Wickerhamomyces pijperi TaxID=599730 RepID=A0A9P8QET1_WICPI|nr:hypothetical protein WICPIJ_001095 [Wickerhamomyces pijperi]